MDESRTGRAVLWAVPMLLLLIVIGSLVAAAMIGAPGPLDTPGRSHLEAIPSPDPVRLTIGVSCALVLTALAIRLARPGRESNSGQ